MKIPLLPAPLALLPPVPVVLEQQLLQGALRPRIPVNGPSQS
jgi:hypothetical protein